MPHCDLLPTLQRLGLELRKSPFASGQKRQTGVTGSPCGNHGGGAQRSSSSSLGLGLEFKVKCTSLKSRSLDGAQGQCQRGQRVGSRTQGPQQDHRWDGVWAAGKMHPGLCLLPPPCPARASQAKSSRKPCPGGDHPRADGEHRPLCGKGTCTMRPLPPQTPIFQGCLRERGHSLRRASRPPSSCCAQARDRDRALPTEEPCLAFFKRVTLLIANAGLSWLWWPSREHPQWLMGVAVGF